MMIDSNGATRVKAVDLKRLDLNRHGFKKAIQRYLGGEKINAKYWDGGYLFAASKEWRIKTLEQFNEALAREDEYFKDKMEELIEWFRSNGLNLGEEGDEGLRSRMGKSFEKWPKGNVGYI